MRGIAIDGSARLQSVAEVTRLQNVADLARLQAPSSEPDPAATRTCGAGVPPAVKSLVAESTAPNDIPLTAESPPRAATVRERSSGEPATPQTAPSRSRLDRQSADSPEPATVAVAEVPRFQTRSSEPHPAAARTCGAGVPPAVKSLVAEITAPNDIPSTAESSPRGARRSPSRALTLLHNQTRCRCGFPLERRGVRARGHSDPLESTAADLAQVYAPQAAVPFVSGTINKCS